MSQLRQMRPLSILKNVHNPQSAAILSNSIRKISKSTLCYSLFDTNSNGTMCNNMIHSNNNSHKSVADDINNSSTHNLNYQQSFEFSFENPNSTHNIQALTKPNQRQNCSKLNSHSRHSSVKTKRQQNRSFHSQSNNFGNNMNRNNQNNSLFYHKFNKRHYSSDSESKADYYDVLGISRDTKDPDVKKAFYKLAKKWHPDANPAPEAKEKFSEINEAYQVLSNKEKRANYDRFGHGGVGADMQDFSNVNLHDIFSQIFGSAAQGGGPFGGFPFGGMGGGQQDVTMPMTGKDAMVECNFSFMEAVNGCSREIKIQRTDECKECNNSGIEKGSVATKCDSCSGSGQIRQQSGFMVMQQTCWTCSGSGQSYDACKKCHGSGSIGADCKIDVNIPAGVDDGTRVRIANQGNSGKLGGGRGHAWILCRVSTDDRFERHGSDVHVAIDVPIHTAVLGGTVTVPTLNGEADVKIKQGTQPDHREIMRGKGIRDPATHRFGHQYLHFNVIIPTDINEKQKELLKEFGEIQDAKQENA